MTAPSSPAQVTAGYPYGLGTMLFSQTFGLGDAVGHLGRQAGYLSLLAVVPGSRTAVAVLVVDEHKTVRDAVQQLFAVVVRYP